MANQNPRPGGYNLQLSAPGISSAKAERIAYLLCEGVPRKEVASQMGITGATLKVYMTQIYTKYDVTGGITELIIRYWKAKYNATQQRPVTMEDFS